MTATPLLDFAIVLLVLCVLSVTWKWWSQRRREDGEWNYFDPGKFQAQSPYEDVRVAHAPRLVQRAVSPRLSGRRHRITRRSRVN